MIIPVGTVNANLFFFLFFPHSREGGRCNYWSIWHFLDTVHRKFVKSPPFFFCSPLYNAKAYIYIFLSYPTIRSYAIRISPPRVTRSTKFKTPTETLIWIKRSVNPAIQRRLKFKGCRCFRSKISVTCP